MDTSHLLGDDCVFQASFDKEENWTTLRYYDNSKAQQIGVYLKVFPRMPESVQKEFESIEKLFMFFRDVDSQDIKIEQTCQSAVDVSFTKGTKHTFTLEGGIQQISPQRLADFKIHQGAGYKRKSKEFEGQVKSQKDSFQKLTKELSQTKRDLQSTKKEVSNFTKKKYVVSPQEPVPAGNQPYSSGKKNLITERTSNADRTGMISFEGDLLGVKGIRELISLQLKQIHTLDLNQNCLTNAGLEVLTRVSWPNLKILNLGQNQFTQLTWQVANVKGVTALGLERNFLTVLPENFKELESLERLDLHENEFLLIPPVLPAFKQLLFIWIGGNRIPNIENQEIFKAIRDKFKDDFLQKAPL